MNSLTFEANVTVDHRLPLPPELPVGTPVRVTVELLTAGPLFSPTPFEDVETPSAYEGQPLSLEQMRPAIDWEGGEAR
jgi:hypothetical protein